MVLDGFAMEGEQGDLIAVGSADNVARVVRAHYDADILELDRPLRWRDQDPVSLPWAGQAPDIGVFEVDAPGIAPPVVIARPPVAQPGEPVLLRALMPAEVPGASVQWQLTDGARLEGAAVRHASRRRASGAARARERSRWPDGACGGTRRD